MKIPWSVEWQPNLNIAPDNHNVAVMIDVLHQYTICILQLIFAKC